MNQNQQNQNPPVASRIGVSLYTCYDNDHLKGIENLGYGKS